MNRNRLLCTAGALAGPLFIVATAAQIATRDGFDLSRHAISMLGLGEYGWIQVTTFIVTGVLIGAAALGARRALHPGRAGTWAPALLGVTAAGLVAAGVFTPDGGYGFPAGAPEGMPEHFSWHAILHTVAALLAFVSLIAATFVLARGFASRGLRGWAAASVVTGVALLPLFLWPSQDGAGVRLAIGGYLGFAWVSAVSARLGAAPAQVPVAPSMRWRSRSA